ncbi:MAG: hypothetical protein D6737_00840 [Chloroflexi bacterium]|nr:MAG: hypothetical protein D6737_00840 [Chloroflexota bacterium]
MPNGGTKNETPHHTAPSNHSTTLSLSKHELKYIPIITVLLSVAPLAAVVSGFGIGSLRAYFFYLILPAFIAFGGIVRHTKKTGHQMLYNRLVVGILAGIALTIALDVVRLTGFNLGYLPADMPQRFGLQIMGLMPMRDQPTTTSTVVGYLYHFFNGIAFAVIYTTIFGRIRWWVGVLYAVLFVEVGMMTLPPMSQMTGYFGLNLGQGIWNGVFLTTLFAHIAMGLVLGGLAQRFAHGGPVWWRWKIAIIERAEVAM